MACYFAILHRLTIKLVVRERHLESNHCIGPNIAAHYSANKKLITAQKDEVNEMLSLKSKVKHL